MIVEATGSASKVTGAQANVTLIVSSTGTAYPARKVGKIKAVIRFIKRLVRPVREKIYFFTLFLQKTFLATKTGKPTTNDSPVASSH